MTEPQKNPQPDQVSIGSTPQKASGPNDKDLIIPEISPRVHLFDQAVSEGLAASNERSLSGRAGGIFLRAWSRQLTRDYSENRTKMRRAHEEINNLREEIAELKSKIAVYQERECADAAFRNLRNLALLAGPLLLKMGYDLFKDQFAGPAWMCGIIGCVLIGVGWHSGRRQKPGAHR
jgi:hypothetical protein